MVLIEFEIKGMSQDLSKEGTTPEVQYAWYNTIRARLIICTSCSFATLPCKQMHANDSTAGSTLTNFK
jgi:hypothetical protein